LTALPRCTTVCAAAEASDERKGKMRSVVHDRYGPPEVLRVADVARPVPKDDEVLVGVRASTVTRGDAMGVRGVEYRFTRVFTGIRRPRQTIFGSEFAGRVEEVGPAVTEFSIGDEVFGIKRGATAEFVAVRETGVIAQKPASLTYDEAAGVPDGSLLALTCLQPSADSLRQKSVLVFGAAGSIGTAAVQLLAHHFDAEVTAVCDTKDVELVRSLGAQHVVDRLNDFTKRGATYDVIFDAVGKHSFRRCRGSLKTGGTFITVDLGFMYHVPFLALLTRFGVNKRARLGIGRYRKEDLILITELIAAGAYRPVIDRTYPLDEIVEATRYVESGQKTGNVVLRVTAPAS
jgi:NADPH:quinone reductase-like Zn-dependent oxidoreductase